MQAFLSLFLMLYLMITLTSCMPSIENCSPEIISETYVHKYGLEVPPDEWRERGQHGQVISTLKNGVAIYKTYSEGKLDGETTYSFPYSEVVEKREIYSKNVLVKKTVAYHTGSPKKETLFEKDGSKKVTTWYESGAPHSHEEYDAKNNLIAGQYFNPQGNQETSVVDGRGVRTERTPFGQLISKDEIENGQMILRTTFYPNEVPKEISQYKNGVVDGHHKTFTPNGEPESVAEWKEGKQEGITTTYQNGEKFSETPYKAGVKEGTEKRYKNGNEVVEEITWENNVKKDPNKFSLLPW